MPITPLPGVQPNTLLDVLRQVHNSASMAQASGGSATDHLVAYARWARNAASQLARMLRPEDVDRLVLTRRHWVIQGLDPQGLPETIEPLVNLELEERVRTLANAVSKQEAIIERWVARTGLVVVADTNVYVEHEEPLASYDWQGIVGAGAARGLHLVVPTIVIDELDGLKRHNRQKVKSQARQKLRTLEELLLENPLGVAELQPMHDSVGAVTVELLLDDPEHVRLPHPDDELVDRALTLSVVAGRQVHFVTGDHGALFRGAVADLVVYHLPTPDDD